jgi:hypothetical protein
MTAPRPSKDMVPVADIEIDAVQPTRSGFVLAGQGNDGAEYRLEMQMDMPIDQRTRTVLGEILVQSEWRLWRRAPRSLRQEAAHRTRKPAT